MENIQTIEETLRRRIATSDEPVAVLRAPELKNLYESLKTVPSDQKSSLGKTINDLKRRLSDAIDERLKDIDDNRSVSALDVTAPFSANIQPENRPRLLGPTYGSRHPLTSELERVIDIFTHMGFAAIESRQLDDDFHMFASLNFPEGHPARDGYDTFRTAEGLIPPAHTSTMQHRILVNGREALEAYDRPIASISYGRVFRNEDVDATHEHTFYQVEGVYVSKTANLGNMLATLRSFFEVYYAQKLHIKTQPAYFPFVEPGLEFAIEKPAALGGKPGEWLEMLGCGMMHPNVLSMAGIDPEVYSGFAWGGGLERLVMLAHNIEDLRHFESAKLAFLRKF